MNSSGFICLHRGESVESLLADSSAFRLLVLICLRARWRSDVSPDGLRRGQARIGADDVNRRLGLSRKEYRCALARLVAAEQISVAAIRGLGTVVQVGSKCVFSTEVRKRADLGAGRGADRFPSENATFGADLGADSRAMKGPLRNKETQARVQNPGPKPPGFESREKRTQRERPQAADSLSDLQRWIAEIQAKPEFENRIDIEDIARICAPIRNAAHLERLVRDERKPAFRKKPRPQAGFDEPKGWREYLTGLPDSDWRRAYADRAWASLPALLAEQLSNSSHAA